MWYHIYIMYFLFAVVFALVIMTMLLTKDTTIRVVYQRTHEDNDPIDGKFDNGEQPFKIISGLDLVAGDEVMIATSGDGGAYNVEFILGETPATKSTVKHWVGAASATIPVVRLHAPETRDDYAIRYTGGTNAILEFIEVHSSHGLF